MLHTIIQKNTYMDSVELMVLSKKLGQFENVDEATVMMGTPANLDIMRKGGFGSDELEKAKPNDMVIAVKTDDDSAWRRCSRRSRMPSRVRRKRRRAWATCRFCTAGTLR